eukprot:COSAG01_NODE_51007_length_358_cov_1.069498_1_plen_36_part_10
MDQKKLDEIFDAIREGDEDYLGAYLHEVYLVYPVLR